VIAICVRIVGVTADENFQVARANKGCRDKRELIRPGRTSFIWGIRRRLDIEMAHSPENLGDGMAIRYS
jgi:hypothetical protein